jgi:hypothetical protein
MPLAHGMTSYIAENGKLYEKLKTFLMQQVVLQLLTGRFRKSIVHS